MSYQPKTGEWEVSKHGTPDAHPQYGVHAGAGNDHAIVKGENARADAFLIAAAPDLLAALVEYVERHEAACDATGLPEYDKARAAIAKAVQS